MVSIENDLAEFVGQHSSHGTLAHTATEPTPNGYMVVGCSAASMPADEFLILDVDS